MPKKTAQGWDGLEQELYAAGVDPAEVEAGSRRFLAEARGHQLAEARTQLGLTQPNVAAQMGVSVARVSQREHGEGATLDVIARYGEALGGRLDLVDGLRRPHSPYADQRSSGQRRRSRRAMAPVRP